MHTGDEGYLDPEGYFIISGRIKDLIIRGGENISPMEIEDRLNEHESVVQCAIVGVEDEKYGERPKAFVTLTEQSEGSSGAGSAEAVNETEILTWAKSHPSMSGFMMPREVEILKELPKTSTGKVRKNVLREWAKGGSREVEDG